RGNHAYHVSRSHAVYAIRSSRLTLGCMWILLSPVCYAARSEKGRARLQRCCVRATSIPEPKCAEHRRGPGLTGARRAGKRHSPIAGRNLMPTRILVPVALLALAVVAWLLWPQHAI